MESLSEKHVYTKKIAEMAVNSTIINCNAGFLSINHVFDSLDFPAGKFFFLIANQKDNFRLKIMERKSLERKKKRRKTLRPQGKGFIDLEKENEGENTYKVSEIWIGVYFGGCFALNLILMNIEMLFPTLIAFFSNLSFSSIYKNNEVSKSTCLSSFKFSELFSYDMWMSW